MKSYRIFSYALIGALLTTIAPMSYGQATWKERLTQAAPEFLTKASKNLKEFLSPTISALQAKTSQAIGLLTDKLKNSNPSAVISLLQDTLKSLGSKIDTIGSCMLGSGSCSTKDRAVFIGTAITVLALTAIVIGYTITVAATAQEVDQEVTRVSQEVQGWKPSALFARLTNTVNEFKATLDSMKTCLINRACTKNQKNLLYATAATIAALATIAVGIGVGSYLYADKVKKEEAVPVEQILAQVGDTISETLPESVQPVPAPAPKELSFKPAFEVPDFNALSSAITTQISEWQKKVQEQLPIINTATLQETYNSFKQRVVTRAIATKDQAADFINKTVLNIQQMPALVTETLGVNFSAIEKQFRDFSSAVKDVTTLLKSKLGLQSFSDKFQQAYDYINETMKKASDAKNAWDSFMKDKNKLTGLFKAFVAKLTSPEEFVKKLEKVKSKKDEIEKDIKKLAENWIAQKIALEASCNNAKSAAAQAVKNSQRQLNAAEEQCKKNLLTATQQYEQQSKKLAERNDKIGAQMKKLVVSRAFDEFVSIENLKDLYPKLVAQINSLDLANLGTLTDLFLSQISRLLNILVSLHRATGTIGKILINDDLDNAIKELSAGINNLAAHLKDALTAITPATPVVVNTNLSLWGLTKALFKAFGDNMFSYLRTNLSQIKRSLSALKAIAPLIDPLQIELGVLQYSLEHMKDETWQKFKTALTNNPITGIAQTPALLRNAFTDTLSITEQSLDKVLENTGKILSNVEQATPALFQLIKELNDKIGDVIGNEKIFLNRNLIEKIEPIVRKGGDLTTITTAVQKLLTVVKNILTDLKRPAMAP